MVLAGLPNYFQRFSACEHMRDSKLYKSIYKVRYGDPMIIALWATIT